MQVTKDEPAFTPVTVTIETVAELSDLMSALHYAARWNTTVFVSALLARLRAL